MLTIIALIGFAGLCQAQDPINISFDSGVPSQFYDASPNNPGGTLNYFWQSTNGPDGSGCEVYEIDGVTNQEIDPAFNATFNGADYVQITFQLKVDPSSGTIGNPLLSDYGNLQLSVRDASFSWNTEFYSTIYGPAANQWVTYTATVPAIQAAHIQIQLQGGAAYSGPVKVYIGNVSVLPPPDPLVLEATNSTINWQNYGLNASWDTSEDSPYVNPVNNSAPVSLLPAGSVEFQASNPSSYAGGQLNLPFKAQAYQYVAFDLYYDGPTPSTTNDYAGFQIFVANGASPYNWAYIGSANFTAGMVGQWTHFNLPCAATGITNAAGFAIQTTPGSTGGHNPITFHIDNIQAWNPQVRPQIISLKPNTTPGGLQIALDGDGTSNPNDQEGICTPSATNNAADFFWIGQTPATYSFTLTNFPTPATAPGFDAHLYVFNGDSLVNDGQSFGYNETYSGVNYNAVDAIALDVVNLTNGIAVNFTWKTNTPSSNITNGIFCNLTNGWTSANGAWALNFSDNTHASITFNGTVITNFTVPDFSSDPNYNANFTPPTPTSAVDFGVYKDGNNTNDNQSAIFTSVQATNTTVAITDNFSGPGLTGNNNWQVAEYYQYSANRTTWIPANTAFWLEWNSTISGFNVQSSTSLLGTWANAGVTYTYIDGTGTNTIAAIPDSILPVGGVDFFDLLK